jgi:hypothetical protein
MSKKNKFPPCAKRLQALWDELKKRKLLDLGLTH